MGRTRTLRQLALAAAITLSPIAAFAAPPCPAATWAQVVACAAAGDTNGDVIILGANVQPDNTPVVNNFDIGVVNGPFFIDGAVGSLVKAGAGTLILPTANTYVGGTVVTTGFVAVGDAGSLGSGPLVLAGGGVLGTANFTLATANLQVLAPGGIVAANPATIFQVSNVVVGAGAVATLGNAALNGTIDVSGLGVMDPTGALAIEGTVRATDATGLNGLTSTAATTAIAATGVLDANGQPVVIANIAGVGEIAINGAGAVQLNNGTYAGVISGPGTLAKDTAGTVILTGTNTNTGTIVIAAGTLSVGAGGTTGTLGNGPTVTNNGILEYNRSDASAFSQAIDGTGTLQTINATGTLVLSGASTYTGPTIVGQGTLTMVGSNLNSVITAVNGVLNGNGAASAVTVTGGVLAPGLPNGILTTAGLTMAPTATAAFEIAGATVGVDYDTVNVVGTVDLGAAVLNLSGAYAPASGNSFVLVANDGGDPIINTFSGLPEGTAFPFNGATLQISYVGGDGNDVLLSVLFTVTPSAGANGTIAPNTPQLVVGGNTTAFTVTPDPNYVATVGGTCGGTLVGNTYTTNAIVANCTVDATFALITYTVTPSAGANGTIAPNTPQSVGHGLTTAFTVTPSAGYTASVGGTCGGTLVGNTYTTNPITAACSVDATFTLINYTVTPSAGANGTIAPNTPQIVASGATTVFTVTPNATYTAVVGGTCGGTLVGNTYTTNAITADCTVDATFTQITFTVTPSAGANGTIAPNTPQIVASGATTVFTVTPNATYTAVVGGTCGGTLVGNTYTTNAITADCTVDATFTQITFTVTPSAGANGTIAPNTPQIVASGATTVFTVTPNATYTAVVGGTCGGTLVGNTYTTNAITANCTVDATFTQITFTVTPSAGANGTIAPNTPQIVASGATTVFTVTPNATYTAVVGGTCGGTLVGNTYTTNAITANCTVAATFTQNTFTVTPSAGANGTIAPNTPQVVASGATTVFTVTPSAGFNAVVGGTCGGTLVGNTYTTNAITANCTVAATFTAAPVTTFSGSSATGTGTITAVLAGGGAGCGFGTRQFIPVTGHAASPPAGSAPAGVSFPHGLFDFTVTGCTPGSTVTITITYPSAVGAGAQYYKYGPEPGNTTPHWYVMPGTVAGTTATISITDGGQGDDDLLANGTIVDQGGPGVPPGGGGPGASVQTPTMTEWGLIIMSILMLLTGMGGFRRKAYRGR